MDIKANKLTIYRRHVKSCSMTAPTFRPQSKREGMADRCRCPIVAQGYLLQETLPDGKQKRILHLSLGTNEWSQAVPIS
jgi:hypothetical protein